MIQVGSYLKVKDNSGACLVKCISIVGKNKKIAFVGDVVLVSVSKYYIQEKLERRNIYLGAIVGSVYLVSRPDGSSVNFVYNCVLLFSKKFKFVGSRIYGMFIKEVNIVNFKNKRLFLKVLSYARGLI